MTFKIFMNLNSFICPFLVQKKSAHITNDAPDFIYQKFQLACVSTELTKFNNFEVM